MLRSLYRYRSVLALVGAAASWGVGTVISKRAVEEIDPFILLPIQLAISITFLTLAGRQLPRFGGRRLRRVSLLGVLNPGISYSLNLWGLTFISASVSVLLWAVEPVLILGLAALILAEKITPRIGILSALALAGVLLVIYEPGGQLAIIGVLLTVAGVSCCAIYTVGSRQLVSEAADESNLTVVAGQQAAALIFALLLLILAALITDIASVASVTWAGWASALGSGIFYYGLAFWLYIAGLRHIPASSAGVYMNLVPIFGIAASYVLLGEGLGVTQWLGAVITIAAVASLSVSRGGQQRSVEVSS